jgi:hypothetical protein
MLELNKIATTKSGEKLKPFLIQNDFVYCFTKNGGIVMKTFNDFDFNKETKKENIVVIPSAPIKQNEEVTPTTPTDTTTPTTPTDTTTPTTPTDTTTPTTPTTPTTNPTGQPTDGKIIPDEDYV